MDILEQMAIGKAPYSVPLTVDQYHEMIATGILREGDSIELIDGILVRKDRSARGSNPMSHEPSHASGVQALLRRLCPVEERGFHLRGQLPVTLGTMREPEPDLALVRGPEEQYRDQHPGPRDIVALVEVSDSSLTFDRTTKQRLYASAAIPIYWIVNLVEVYQDPQPAEGRYARRTDYLRGQTVTLTLGPDLEVNVAVAELLPGCTRKPRLGPLAAAYVLFLAVTGPTSPG
jgi:Uma2 family endonuclease